jgi:hypothetical protein
MLTPDGKNASDYVEVTHINQHVNHKPRHERDLVETLEAVFGGNHVFVINDESDLPDLPEGWDQ